ncbi:MAG: NAD(P)/FAD-dependent oxidoreductase [Rhodothermales bacterium]
MSGPSVGIVGAGPVGMYLALRLVRSGFDVRVYDGRREVRPHSRSIGIHPPAVALLRDLGLGPRLLERACVVTAGQGWWNGRPVGRVALDGLGSPLLTLPQHETEQALQDLLQQEAPGVLRLGEKMSESDVEALASDSGVVVGCDGRNSVVRKWAGCAWEGGSYSLSYVMGDAPDTTPFGTEAVIMLGRKGLVECFPLPGGARRWVVRLMARPDMDATLRSVLSSAVADRTPFRIHPAAFTMTSAFGVERFESRPMTRGKAFLLGDAAHILSPIGGQGMNLGWLDAEALHRALIRLRAGSVGAGKIANQFAGERRRVFRAAARRAEFNMWMGAACGPGGAAARRSLMAVALAPRIRDAFLRRFTMEGLSA